MPDINENYNNNVKTLNVYIYCLADLKWCKNFKLRKNNLSHAIIDNVMQTMDDEDKL